MKKIIIIGILLVLILPAALSFSLIGGVERIYFEPGLETTASFLVANSAGHPAKRIELRAVTRSEALNGILDQVVSIREPKVVIEEGETHKFFVDLTLPDSLPYGIHEVYIVIEGYDLYEKNKASIEVKVAYEFRIIIYSLYPGKYIEGGFSRPDAVSIGEVFHLKAQVRNIGTEDIENARAKFDIYRDGNIIGSVYSDYARLASKNEGVFSGGLLITEGYKIGEYTVKASVEYDGKTEGIGSVATFKVGELSIDILNITSRKFANDKVNKFEIDVESKWNKPAEVYADIIITDFSEVEKARFKTQSISLDGWEKEKIPAFFDIRGIENGFYTLKVILNYEGKRSEKQFAVDVSDVGEAEIVDEMPGMPKTSLIIVILLSAIIVLLVVIVLMSFFRRRNTGINQNGF